MVSLSQHHLFLRYVTSMRGLVHSVTYMFKFSDIPLHPHLFLLLWQTKKLSALLNDTAIIRNNANALENATATLFF